MVFRVDLTVYAFRICIMLVYDQILEYKGCIVVLSARLNAGVIFSRPLQ